MASEKSKSLNYQDLVKSLLEEAILKKWPEIIPVAHTSGSSLIESETGRKVSEFFEGHDEEQIRLMDELCIVLDFDDLPVGAATKKLCHLMENINQGLLHRAFSVFLFNPDGKLLLQQRADEKITFPNMWTNTCCSHPLCISSELGTTDTSLNAREQLTSAIEGAIRAAQRKLDHELGIPKSYCPTEAFKFLTRIHYKSASGGETSHWGEHEIDYILVVKSKEHVPIQPNFNEVKDYKYVNEDELKEMLANDQLVFTPWFKLICETFLTKWWKSLDDLSSYQDEKIHRLL